MEDSIIILDNDSTIVLDSSDSEFNSMSETDLPDNTLNIEPMLTSTPEHSLLETVHARFEQNHQEASRRISALKSRRLFEIAHRKHLIKNVIVPTNNTVSSNSQTAIDNENLNKILTNDYHNAKRKFMDSPSNNAKRLCASTSLRHNMDASPLYISDSLACPSSGFSLSEESCCPVIGCGIKMSSEENLEFHMSLRHTPCNPFQNILDSSLPDTVLFYLCPKCGQQFKDIKICYEHQERELHNEFIKPIAVSSFLCPLCLQVFPTESSCIEHMHVFQHLAYHYGFSNDKNGINCKPIPLPKHLALDFKSKCDKVNSWMTCVDCNLKLTDAEAILNHHGQNHLLSCVADKKPADVFSEYLGDVTCSRCQQVFQTLSHKMFGKLHFCTIMLSGIFQANDCRSFEEFVRRSSIAIQVENMPPPSPSTIINSERNQKRILQSKLLFQSSQPKKICLSSETSRNVHSIGTKVTKLNSINHNSRKSGSECKKSELTQNHNGNSDNIFSIENPFKNLKIQIENTGFQKSQFPQASEFKVPLIWDTKDLDGCKADEKLTKTLMVMNQIIFLDLDNWPGFFKKLPFCLPDLTFVWAFYGGNTRWIEPNKCITYDELKQKGYFYLNKKSGRTKDAADFALVFHVGKMDERLPQHISFTILSGDKCFYEVENQLKNSKRLTKVIDPHRAQKESYDFLYALLKSIAEK